MLICTLMTLWTMVASAADVAIVVDGAEASDPISAALIAELGQLSRGAPPSTETFYGGFTMDGASRALDAAYATNARVVAVVGPLSSELVLARGRSPTHTIAALALSDTLPPDNVVKLQLERPLDEPLALLSHVVGSDDVALALPPVLAELEGVWSGELTVVALDPSAPPPDVDGVLIGAADYLAPAERQKLFAQWTDAGIATLLLHAPALPEHVLGVYRNDSEQDPVMRRVALTAVQLLDGSRSRDATVGFEVGELVLSADVLERLDLSLPFDVLADAEVVGWGEQLPQLTLQQAVAEAFVQSPELAAFRTRIGAENTGTASARATWLPQVEVGATASHLDDEVASVLQPQTSVEADVTATQLLWSDGAATNVRVQNDLRASRDAELVAAEQDLAYDVGVAFVSLQRAQAVIAVRAADIDRARGSLDVARKRVRAGDAAGSEVARWEGEVANARAALVQSWTDFRAAMVNLNRICGVQVDRMVIPVSEDLEPRGDLRGRLGSPRGLDRFSAAAAELAVERAPELSQLDSALQAQQRLERLASRAYYMPTFAVQGSVNLNVYQSPTDPIVIPGVGELSLVDNPRSYWVLGASATVPVFSGGQRRAEQSKARLEVSSLEHQVRQIDLAVRSRATIAVAQAHGTMWKATLREESAEAALRSLGSAQSAYAAGAVTLTTVTEARTNALQVRLAATDARYEAELRVLEVLRAAAALPTPTEPDAPAALLSTLLEHLEDSP